MNKKAKLSLAGVVLYTTTSLALPVYVLAKQDNAEELPLINLEQVTSVSQAENLYKEKIAEYSSDKELSSQEIRNLHSIVTKESQLMKTTDISMTDYLSVKNKTERINTERQELEKELASFSEPNDLLRNYIMERRKKIETDWGKESPGILKKDNFEYNVTYSTDDKIVNEEINNFIRETVIELNIRLSADYNDKSLSDFGKNDSFSFKSVLKILAIMKSYEEKLEKFNEGAVRIAEIDKRIEELKKAEYSAWAGAMTSEQKEDVETLIGVDSSLSGRARLFYDYILFEDKAKDFAENIVDRSKYWSYSLVRMSEEEDSEDYKEAYKFVNENSKASIESAINEYLKSEGLESKVAELKDPTNIKFGALITLALAIGAPILRNILIKTYVGPRDEEEYLMSMGAGFCNGLFGMLIIDGLAPWVYPARMMSPLVLQPLRKWLE
ncbi:MAG: hypothetical protein KKA79_09390 [Nanoarchaeota archaeon]|nr:hypothetical protein [Nanoarchaeota archaeon]MCG2717776.1 hypothetical protein [Nanoarchaeota archaeon]